MSEEPKKPILEEPVQEVKQEEQEESQEEMWNDVYEIITKHPEDCKLLKQHFKIQRR